MKVFVILEKGQPVAYFADEVEAKIISGVTSLSLVERNLEVTNGDRKFCRKQRGFPMRTSRITRVFKPIDS